MTSNAVNHALVKRLKADYKPGPLPYLAQRYQQSLRKAEIRDAYAAEGETVIGSAIMKIARRLGELQRQPAGYLNVRLMRYG